MSGKGRLILTSRVGYASIMAALGGRRNGAQRSNNSLDAGCGADAPWIMVQAPSVLLPILLAACAAVPALGQATGGGVSPADSVGPRGNPVALSLSGERLYARPHPDPAAMRRADERVAAEPASVDALLAAAREREQAFMYDDAAALYARVVELAPDDWRGWRFRGHRMLTLRRFEDGAHDLERARELAPDNFDVAYHLGLAYYLLGRFDEAASEYLRCLALAEDATAHTRATSPQQAGQRGCVRIAESYDTRVAITEWAYRALLRSGRGDEAQRLLDAIEPGMNVAANEPYYHSLLARRGEWDPAELLDPMPSTGRFETRAYGMALDSLLHGDVERGLLLMRQIAADAHWPGFGRLAAEAELARRAPR